MITLHLIRHGATQGNLLGQYIGSTDEPLCEQGIAQLSGKRCPPADVIYVSPMKRCVQSAQILYPCRQYREVPDFRERDFGRYEGKNYRDLSGNKAYQNWIDSGGTLPFPDGEDTERFQQRCVRAFEELIKTHMDGQSLAFVVHGGTMMSILQRFEPAHRFYDWQVANGCGYTAVYREGTLEVTGTI